MDGIDPENRVIHIPQEAFDDELTAGAYSLLILAVSMFPEKPEKHYRVHSHFVA